MLLWLQSCKGRAAHALLLRQVLFTPGLWVPLVNLKGTYVLPGIPRLFTAMIDAHKEPFRGTACASAVLFTNTVEGDLAGKSLLFWRQLP
jgi:molybdopterin-biosynthesis enzyme MoeA-like protein